MLYCDIKKKKKETVRPDSLLPEPGATRPGRTTRAMADLGRSWTLFPIRNAPQTPRNDSIEDETKLHRIKRKANSVAQVTCLGQMAVSLRPSSLPFPLSLSPRTARMASAALRSGNRKSASFAPPSSPRAERGRPILLFDVMDTIVRDPFYQDVPAFFGYFSLCHSIMSARRWNRVDVEKMWSFLVTKWRLDGFCCAGGFSSVCARARVFVFFCWLSVLDDQIELFLIRMPLKELIECKNPTAWIEFEEGLIDEVPHEKWSLKFYVSLSFRVVEFQLLNWSVFWLQV